MMSLGSKFREVVEFIDEKLIKGRSDWWNNEGFNIAIVNTGIVRNGEEMKTFIIRPLDLWVPIICHYICIRLSKGNFHKCGCCDIQRSIETPLQACGGCTLDVYCSTACQHSHWRKTHKYLCKIFRHLRRLDQKYNFILNDVNGSPRMPECPQDLESARKQMWRVAESCTESIFANSVEINDLRQLFQEARLAYKFDVLKCIWNLSEYDSTQMTEQDIQLLSFIEEVRETVCDVRQNVPLDDQDRRIEDLVNKIREQALR